MTDINSIAKDLNLEVKKQGEKLQTVDDHMTTAVDNVEKGGEQLVKAEKT